MNDAVSPASGSFSESYYDGLSAKRLAASATVSGGSLLITLPDGATIRWPLAELRRLSSPEDILRLSHGDSPARIDLRDPATRREIEGRIGQRMTLAGDEKGSTGRIVFWSIAAAISLVLSVIYLVPLLADRLAPVVPPGLEIRLGDAVDPQIRRLFSGDSCDQPAGRAALDTLTARITTDLDLHVPIQVAILNNRQVNAFALPGGRVYFLEGMLNRARNPDEFAGVLAHEIGHVAHRDGLRRLIQTSGSAFLLGLLFGDVGGAGVAILGGRMLIDASYSRDQERAADDFAARTMIALGRSPQALGALLLRVDQGSEASALDFFASHPMGEERMAALAARDAPVTAPPLLDDAEWSALKAICR
jgi:predicted Zn-dependent protease